MHHFPKKLIKNFMWLRATLGCITKKLMTSLSKNAVSKKSSLKFLAPSSLWVPRPESLQSRRPWTPKVYLSWPVGTSLPTGNTLQHQIPTRQRRNVYTLVYLKSSMNVSALTCLLMLSRLHGKQNLWWATDGHWTKWVSSSRSWQIVPRSRGRTTNNKTRPQ